MIIFRLCNCAIHIRVAFSLSAMESNANWYAIWNVISDGNLTRDIRDSIQNQMLSYQSHETPNLLEFLSVFGKSRKCLWRVILAHLSWNKKEEGKNSAFVMIKLEEPTQEHLFLK